MKRMGIKKVVGLMGYLCVVGMVLLLSSCKSDETLAKNDNRTYKAIIDHFIANKIKISKIQPMSPLSPKADMAALFTIAGKEIIILKYNMNELKQKRKYEQIEEKGTLYIMGVRYTPLFNGAFVMVGFEENPREDDIISAFNSFGFNQ